MKNKKYIYFVEGPCEEKLIDTLKKQPSMICPGKVKVINVLQEELSVSQLLQIQAGTVVALVFDTDVHPTKILQNNIDALRQKCHNCKVSVACGKLKATLPNLMRPCLKGKSKKRAEENPWGSTSGGFCCCLYVCLLSKTGSNCLHGIKEFQ